MIWLWWYPISGDQNEFPTRLKLVLFNLRHRRDHLAANFSSPRKYFLSHVICVFVCSHCGFTVGGVTYLLPLWLVQLRFQQKVTKAPVDSIQRLSGLERSTISSSCGHKSCVEAGMVSGQVGASYITTFMWSHLHLIGQNGEKYLIQRWPNLNSSCCGLICQQWDNSRYRLCSASGNMCHCILIWSSVISNAWKVG